MTIKQRKGVKKLEKWYFQYSQFILFIKDNCLI